MKRAIYPGSFDPVTVGHLDVIERASRLVDELIVAVLINEGKKSLFSLEERVDMLEWEVRSLGNVRVECHEGLLVDFAAKRGVNAIIRGLRGSTDFSYELTMAQTNKALSKDMETIFLITDSKYSYISSSTVKEVAAFGGDVSGFVPERVGQMVREKIKSW